MKTFLAVLFGGGLLFLTGCASGPKITSDFVEGTDYTHYRTFAVLPRVGMGEEATAGPTLTGKVRTAAAQALTAKGFTGTEPARADFLVMVHGRLNPHIDISNYGYGWREGRPWRYGGMAGPGWESPMVGTEITVSNSGRLAVDIIDRRSNELVWRGVARKDYVDDRPDPDRIATVVGLILKGFPPTPSSESTR